MIPLRVFSSSFLASFGISSIIIGLILGFAIQATLGVIAVILALVIIITSPRS